MKVHLSIVIPCYNEKASISKTVGAIAAHMASRHARIPWELILVNDGSTDGTGELLAQLERKNRFVRSCGFQKNRGRGAAIKEGLGKARGAWTLCLDADLSYDVNHISEILAAFDLTPTPDVVVVSAYMKGGVVEGVPLQRELLSRFANWLIAGSFPGRLRTVTCVVRGYRTRLVQTTPFFEEGKELHLEMLRNLALRGARILEIPGRLVWKPGDKKTRRKNPLKIFSAGWQHLLYGLLMRPSRVFQVAAALLFLLGVYESAIIAVSTVQRWQDDPSLAHAFWLALNASFQHSPHSFFIMIAAYILSFQTASFLVLIKLMGMQQQESLRHLLAIQAATLRPTRAE